ncbi:hypothetical protein ES703_89693 [subsurface metagenome]
MADAAPAHTITRSASRPSLTWRRRAGKSSSAWMASSAPNRCAASSRYSFISVAITRPTPKVRATCTWSNPAMPLPMTRTLSPGDMCAILCPRRTQASGSIKVASSSDTSSGSRNTPRSTLMAGNRIYSAKPPGSKLVRLRVSQTV